MTMEAAQRVTTYLRDRVGEGLRTVVIVHADDWEVHYLRDDLKEAYTEETFTEVVDTFRLEQPFMSPGIASRPVGERRAIIHHHENALVIQFPLSTADSILISLTPDTGRYLIDFIETCRQLVHETS